MIAGSVIAAGLAALWLLLPAMLAARWTAQLRGLGFPQAELAIDSLGWNRAVGAFSLGGDQGADRVEIAFTPGGLWRGRVAGVHVAGLRLTLPLSAPASLDASLDGPVTFEGARITLNLPAGLPAQTVTAAGALTPVDGGWHGEVDGDVRLGPVGVPAHLALDWRGGGLTAVAFRFTPPATGPQLTGQGVARRLADGRWTGEGEATARLLPDGAPDMAVRFRGGQGVASLEWAGSARLDAVLDPNGQGRSRLSAKLKIADLAAFAARLGRADLPLTGGPVELSLAADALELGNFPPKWPDIGLALTARGVGLGRGPRDNALTLGATARRIDGVWWLAPATDVPGSLSVPTLGLTARGVALTGAAALPLDLGLNLAGLRLPWLAPLALSARLRGDPGGDMRIEWAAAADGGALSLSGGIDLSLATGGGSAVARLAPVRLGGGGGASASALFPGAPLPGSLTGTLAARLTAGWNAESADGGADLLLEEAGIVLPGLRLQGVNGVLRFDRLSPLSMPAQTIAVASADAGIQLTGGAVALSLPGDGVLRLTPETFLWAGQRVIPQPSLFRLGNDYLDMVIDMPAIPLTNALAAVGVDGMQGDGVLIGSVPIRIGAKATHLGPGILRATGPGRLALSGPIPPPWLDPVSNDSLALVTRALADYRYDRLELVLSSDRLHRLSLDGANPALYGGYRMPMNLALAPATPEATPPVPLPPSVAAAIAAFKARKD